MNIFIAGFVVGVFTAYITTIMIKLDFYHWRALCSGKKLFGKHLVWKRVYLFGRWTCVCYLALE